MPRPTHSTSAAAATSVSAWTRPGPAATPASTRPAGSPPHPRGGIPVGRTNSKPLEACRACREPPRRVPRQRRDGGPGYQPPGAQVAAFAGDGMVLGDTAVPRGRQAYWEVVVRDPQVRPPPPWPVRARAEAGPARPAAAEPVRWARAAGVCRRPEQPRRRRRHLCAPPRRAPHASPPERCRGRLAAELERRPLARVRCLRGLRRRRAGAPRGVATAVGQQ